MLLRTTRELRLGKPVLRSTLCEPSIPRSTSAYFPRAESGVSPLMALGCYFSEL